jgi:hypothetical protein
MARFVAGFDAQRRISSYLAFLLVILLTTTGTIEGQETKPKVSDEPLTLEQLAVYRAVLMSWFNNQERALNLAVQTDPIDPSDASFDRSCMKGLVIEKTSADEVHRFREEDLAQMGIKKVRLVDPEAQVKEVAENDPGKAMLEGKPVDDAVENGFSHGLFTFNEIEFDKYHRRAIVSFSFVCGGLCGHGTTMLLEKRNGVWKRIRFCGGWQA